LDTGLLQQATDAEIDIWHATNDFGVIDLQHLTTIAHFETIKKAPIFEKRQVLAQQKLHQYAGMVALAPKCGKLRNIERI
jgi:hypothetical protein